MVNADSSYSGEYLVISIIISIISGILWSWVGGVWWLVHLVAVATAMYTFSSVRKRERQVWDRVRQEQSEEDVEMNLLTKKHPYLRKEEGKRGLAARSNRISASKDKRIASIESSLSIIFYLFIGCSILFLIYRGWWWLTDVAFLTFYGGQVFAMMEVVEQKERKQTAQRKQARSDLPDLHESHHKRGHYDTTGQKRDDESAHARNESTQTRDNNAQRYRDDDLAEMRERIEGNSVEACVRQFIDDPYYSHSHYNIAVLTDLLRERGGDEIRNYLTASSVKTEIEKLEERDHSGKTKIKVKKDRHLNYWQKYKNISFDCKEIIHGFVRKKYASLKEGYNPNEFYDMHKILSNKGVDIGEDELRQVVYALQLQREKDDLLDRFPSQDVDELLEKFARSRPDGRFHDADVEVLAAAAKDLGETWSQQRIRDALDRIYERKRLERKEEELKCATKYISFEELDSMGGKEFEDFLSILFIKLGYEVESPPHSRDQGADLIAKYGWERIAIQAKRYSQSVGIQAIQEVVAAMKPYNCDRAIVVTNSDFTEDAIELADHHSQVELWDRSKLKDTIRHHADIAL